jgi:hypothetical protein
MSSEHSLIAELEQAIKTGGNLPDSFALIRSHDTHLRRQCSVAWRSPTAVGVEFSPSVEAIGKKADY